MNVKEKEKKKEIVIEKTPKDQLIIAPSKDIIETQKSNAKKIRIKKFFIIKSILITLFSVLLLCFIFFTVYNTFNTNIISGVHIKGIDVSHMSASDAKYKIDSYLDEHLPKEIKLVHGDYEATISLEQININFDTKSAANTAYNVGRQGNIFENNMYILSNMFGEVNIEPSVKLDRNQLTKNLEEISANLPDKVTESSYFIEDSNLIVTSGKDGNVVDIDATINAIKTAISNLSTIDQPIEIIVKTQSPKEINIEKIHEEIYKEPVDAYYTQDPFTVYPSENGVDFKISTEEAKALINSKSEDEYTIPLKITIPNVTTNMIGTEAFPDLLANYSTKYSTNNNRTTNLILAANKINGTVLMPGETFSYNKTVGARTIAAGYREAPIYVSGKVVDGVGGGICQIATTLYNAVVYANLEIVQRSNHQFIPSYAPASRDATVVYGAIDFQFKNNREYPIKIVSSVSGGIANFKIFGLKQENDCEVEISAYQTGKTATAIYSEAYKILKKDGKVVSRELLSKDAYKRH